MNEPETLAVVGSGPSALYLLKHLLDRAECLKGKLRHIAVFEKSPPMGMGMPYTPRTADRFSMSNISSEELPELIQPFADWLRSQSPESRLAWGMGETEIREDEVYPRLALGHYLQAQYREITARLGKAGIPVIEHPGGGIADIVSEDAEGQVLLRQENGKEIRCDRVVIATGHFWPDEDEPEAGYYASPWPLKKLLPAEGVFHRFRIGTMGASLSAFDVITSLAHRHGRFEDEEDGLSFHPYDGAEDFQVVMHAANGLLPHLQFDQVEPMREIYRHVDRETLFGLCDGGFLRLETYFDRVCRPAFVEAFGKDGNEALVAKLSDPAFGLEDFIETMTGTHEYDDAFEGMKAEMAEARASVENRRPVHWKEVLDDLMYTLNFHAEFLPAEDHRFLKSTLMPFVMNVVAAMPLSSARILLALHDAGKLNMVSGKVEIAGKSPGKGTTVKMEDGGKTYEYPIFVDCSGQKPLEMEELPFGSLVKDGWVRKARARFCDAGESSTVEDDEKSRVFKENGDVFYEIGGIDIDDSYHLIGKGGQTHPRIWNIAFPQIAGLRPYSYGLQSCNETAGILVRRWAAEG